MSSNLLACSNGWSSASVGFCQEAQGSHGGLVGGLSGNTKEAREFVWRRDFCARQCAHICGQGKVLVSRCSKNPWVMICGCLELAHIARIRGIEKICAEPACPHILYDTNDTEHRTMCLVVGKCGRGQFRHTRVKNM